MKIPIGISRLLTIGALLGLMVLAVLGFRAQEKDMESLRESSQEIIYWSTSQGEAEIGRFLAVLGRFALDDEEVTTRDVNRRFDILWSRIELFRQGDVGRRIRTYDSERNTIAYLFDLLEIHEDAIVNISRDDPLEVKRRILADFVEAGQQLRALSVSVLAGEELRLGSARDAVRSSARLTWMFSMAALVLSLLMIGIMLIETRRYRRMAEESSELAARAEAASRAKSRFLTMMSHELRTPMNGVLGPLALARQTPLNERQLRLVDQAERSGRQMSALLGDILDFSDLQSESLIMESDAFELSALADAVLETFGPAIQRENVQFKVDVAADAPRWVVGDLARLRQILGHIATFLIDVVGSKDVHVVMSGVADGVSFDIDAAVHGSDQAGWQPEAMFDRVAASSRDFASDSLGPMIARGLVSLMGGQVTLTRPVEGRAKVSIVVPLETDSSGAEHVRIEASSLTVGVMLTALLRKLALSAWEPDALDQNVFAVLMEAGGDEESARAARLRADHPAALLVAIGHPQSPNLFDAICAQPVTAETLSTALVSRKGALAQVS